MSSEIALNQAFGWMGRRPSVKKENLIPSENPTPSRCHAVRLNTTFSIARPASCRRNSVKVKLERSRTTPDLPAGNIYELEQEVT
jgi:hypothetical protein